MQLSKACEGILRQLSETLLQIAEADYARSSAALGGSSVGQHVRHTLEFFICLEHGVGVGTVNYDLRAHDKLVETDKFVALSTIARISEFIHRHQHDRELQLEVGYDPSSEACIAIATNYFRELTYNIEHAVHHMAIIKIGLREVAPYIKLPADFGVAISTIRHQNQTLAAFH